jgi:hypothetical protein
LAAKEPAQIPRVLLQGLGLNKRHSAGLLAGRIAGARTILASARERRLIDPRRFQNENILDERSTT